MIEVGEWNESIIDVYYPYEVRFKERFALRNPRKLHHRQCMCEERGHGYSLECKIEF